MDEHNVFTLGESEIIPSFNPKNNKLLRIIISINPFPPLESLIPNMELKLINGFAATCAEDEKNKQRQL